jgi:hypothetical protein
MRSKSEPLTKASLAIIDAGAAIGLDRATPEDAAFIARQFVQATLPHSDPKTNTWSRRNGNYTLSLQTGFDSDGTPIGLPYGVIPRLLVFWLVTEAVRTKNPVLELGHNLAGFMREIGLDPTHGGKRGDPQRLEIQMRRFFSARLAFFAQLSEGGRAGETAEFMPVARGYTLWWDSKRPQQGTLWGSSVKLDYEFFQAIIAAPVPVDTRALRALKRSPLALDLYALCCYEAFRVQRTGRARIIPWRALMKQLGSDYEGEHAARDFGVKCRAALRKICAVMPSLRLGTEPGGLAILPGSSPAITTPTFPEVSQ